MNLIKKSKWRMIAGIIIGILIVLGVAGIAFPDIDLAILENGQYNEDWQHIHLMPTALGEAARDLKAKRLVTVHHSKYALARHPWDEPLKNELEAATRNSLDLIAPEIGEVVELEVR